MLKNKEKHASSKTCNPNYFKGSSRQHPHISHINIIAFSKKTFSKQQSLKGILGYKNRYARANSCEIFFHFNNLPILAARWQIKKYVELLE